MTTTGYTLSIEVARDRDGEIAGIAYQTNMPEAELLDMSSGTLDNIRKAGAEVLRARGELEACELWASRVSYPGCLNPIIGGWVVVWD